jgi:Tfp pilus assembly protein PilF
MKLPETSLALGYERQGSWELAQQSYEQAMAAAQTKGRELTYCIF